MSLELDGRGHRASNGVRNRGVAVRPLDELAQAFGIDSLRRDLDTDTRAERTGRYGFIQAEEATVVGLAVYDHLKFLKRYSDPSSAARMAITVASQLA